MSESKLKFIAPDGEVKPVYGACLVFCQSSGIAHANVVTREEVEAADRVARGLQRLPLGYDSFLNILVPSYSVGLIASSYLFGGLKAGPDGMMPHRRDAGVVAALAQRAGHAPFFLMAMEPGVSQGVKVIKIDMPDSCDDVTACFHGAIGRFVATGGMAAAAKVVGRTLH
jgi:hypothetical protein